MAENFGRIVGVNGNLLTVEFSKPVFQNETGFAVSGDLRLKSEVVRIRGDYAELQVFEDSAGLKVGDQVEFTDELLVAELGPGLLAQVFDGLQNPLSDVAEAHGFFLKRGTYFRPLSRDKTWSFTPEAAEGDRLRSGETLGTVPEGLFSHRIMAPFDLKGSSTVSWIAEAGEYTVEEPIARLSGENVVGLTVRRFKDIRFEETSPDLFQTPPWVDDGLEAVKEAVRLKLQKEFLQEEVRLLEAELRRTSQRVNLFEKVKIPECRENIRIIQIALGDLQTMAVVRAKQAKAKLSERSSGL